MLINFSNHSSASWSIAQRTAAEQYGNILDIEFPAVPSECDENYIRQMSEKYVKLISDQRPDCVLCQGEFTLVYAVIEGLKKFGIKVIAACSERLTETKTEDGTSIKNVVFKFVRFREYIS